MSLLEQRCSSCDRGPGVCPTNGRCMSNMSPEDCKARQQFKDVVAKSVDGDQDKAEVLMQRIADRLSGYTHEEVVARHPLPRDSDYLGDQLEAEQVHKNELSDG